MMPESPENNSGSLNLTTGSSSDPTKTMTSMPTLRDIKGSLPSSLNGTGTRPHSHGGSNGSPSPPSLHATSSSSLARGLLGAATSSSSTSSSSSSSTTTATSMTCVSSNNNGGGGGSASAVVTGSAVTNGSSVARSRIGGGAGSGDAQAIVCGSRQLSKVKRFLTTLQQFGSDISTEAGERVRNLIISLVNGTLTIDEFHLKLQETTNFPLRPFVIPFLKANLPLLQREILHCARAAKLSPQQYLHQHENLVLDPAHSPTSEPLEIFHHMSELNENGKRRLSDANNRLKENGNAAAAEQLLDLHGPPPKRHHHHHPLLSSPLGLHPSLPLRLDDYALAREIRERDRLCLDREYRHYVYSPRDILDERETEEEWKNIHTMLNCILGMVEKTKRALAILQHRSQTDRQELAMWIRRHTEGTENNLKKQAGDMMAQTLKSTEDRVSEVKRRAEEAVNEVKRHAVLELQKAVSAAETKAKEMVASERGKMEKLIVEAKRQAADEALAALNQQADSNETCWNCGRKANETCSGCNIARYCGAFCQHKDWENHHHVCGQGGTQSVVSQSVTSSSGGGQGGITSTSVTANSVPTNSASGRSIPSTGTASLKNAITSGSAASVITASAGCKSSVSGGGVKTSGSAILLSTLARSRSSTPSDLKCGDGSSKH